MKPNIIIITLCTMLVAFVAIAQNTAPKAAAASPGAPQTSGTTWSLPPAENSPMMVPDASANVAGQGQLILAQAPAGQSATATAPAQPAAAAPAQPAASTPALPAAPAPVPASAATTVTAPAAPATTALADDTAPTPKNEIRMNFQGASLAEVLNYLSSVAGFVIVQNTPVSGTVNIISKQPVTADMAVTLLDQVLAAKGYTVIRNGRILNIIPKAGSQTFPGMPVIVQPDPKGIDPVDEMVTDIIPVKRVDATKVIENLRPLLAADASMTVNESSNAILITDTKANIHRMAEIIQALDTSVAKIATIKVYPLRYADAKDFATVLTQLFSPDESNNGRNGQGGGGPGGFFARFAGGGGRGGGGGGDDTGAAASDSEARKAETRVVAVADEQSNSVVVSAPEEYISTIDEIVARLDTSTTDVTETRIFQLHNSDSGEVSTILNTLYGDATTLSSTSNNRNGQGNNRGGNRFNQPATPATQPSERELQQARMVAVPDPRTNSILVNCSADTMIEVAQTIGTLDATTARKQQVFVVGLQHADPDNVAPILRALFHDPTSVSGTSNALLLHEQNGVSSAVNGTLTSGGGAGGAGGGGGGVGGR